MSLLGPKEIQACRSIIGTPWRAMPTISRLVVIMADPPTTLPWTPLPAPRPVPRHSLRVVNVSLDTILGAVRVPQASASSGPAPADTQPGPDALRAAAESAARSCVQPDDWAHRVYQSVTGLRWRCCGNLFEDDHHPWCQA